MKTLFTELYKVSLEVLETLPPGPAKDKLVDALLAIDAAKIKLSVPIEVSLQPAGQCADCKRDLMEPYETGAHGDKYCVGCYRYLTSKGAHGL